MYKFGRHWIEKEYRHLVADLAHWLPIASLAGILSGTASAILLASLEWATATREAHQWTIAFLPLAGLLVGSLYHYWGKTVEAGNNFILEEIHNPRGVIPARMTPLILLGTCLTHLFGGSAGREGTAIQTGASLADQLTHLLPFNSKDRRILLMAGISGGFSSVFGTPLAGAVFGMEVLTVGRLGYYAILPCFISAFVADYVTRAWGIHHTVYRVTQIVAFTPATIVYSLIAGIAFGLVGMCFAEATHVVSRISKKYIHWAPARPLVGGVVVASAVFLLGTTRYIGLGIPTIVDSFSTKLPLYDFAAKMLFTVVTLGTSFKGGEVTPLFFIGSTLGNALSSILPLPASLLAGMGFVAVFAGSANTPISSTLMAVELFGPEAGSFAALACVASYLFSGHTGIYHSQRVGNSKHAAYTHKEGSPLAKIGHERLRAGTPPSPLDSLEILRKFSMNNLTVVRLYFCSSHTLPHDSWWRRIIPQNLGIYLLRQAKEIGIEQALLHRIIGGYLKDQNLALEGTSELPSEKLPQCLELVGEDELLRSYIEKNRQHLQRVRVVFLRGEEARTEAEIEKNELEEVLSLEKREHQI